MLVLVVVLVLDSVSRSAAVRWQESGAGVVYRVSGRTTLPPRFEDEDDDEYEDDLVVLDDITSFP